MTVILPYADTSSETQLSSSMALYYSLLKKNATLEM